MPVPFSHDRHFILEESFLRNAFLTKAEQRRLCSLLNLSKIQLRNWFKNRRRRGEGKRIPKGYFLKSPYEEAYEVLDSSSSREKFVYSDTLADIDNQLIPIPDKER